MPLRPEPVCQLLRAVAPRPGAFPRGFCVAAGLALCAATTAIGRAASPEPPDDPPKVAIAAQQDPAFQAAVGVAIDRGVQFLQREAHRDGSITGGLFTNYRSGPTALAAYAMVESGVSPTDPAINLAVDFLYRFPPKKTYSAGCALLLLAEVGGEDNLKLAQSILDDLIEWESDVLRGTWAYPDGGIDLSNAQFAALGFWAADRLGLKVPVDLCRRVVRTTIESYQETPRAQEGSKAKTPEVGRTRAGDKLVAGFSYHPGAGGKPTGSMTAAGIAIQRIMLEIHGRKLGSKEARAIETSVPLALAWLEENWSVTENPKQGGRHLYYLWGIERFASLMGKDTLFGWDWYREGAEVLLRAQTGAGDWGSPHDTAYALLFLARATRAERAAVSGDRGGAAVTAVRQTEGAVQISVTGAMELTAWIHFVEDGVRVETVEWLIDGDVVATVKGNAALPWNGQQYPHRHAPGREEKMTLRARVTGTKDGAAVVLESVPVELQTQWTPAEWFRSAAATAGPNSLASASHSVTASSSEEGNDAARATDGFEGTAWVAQAGDAAPTITVTLDRPVRASVVTLSHAASSIATIRDYAGATRVRLTVNGDATEHELPDQSPGPIEIALPGSVRVRTLTVEILAAATDRGTRRGFSEIGLR